MNRITFLLVYLFLLSSCINVIKESENYISSQKDSLLLDSYNFIKQNMSEYDFEGLFLQGDTVPLFIKDIEFAVQQYKDRMKTDSIPFDIFCNYILPPVISDEKYDDWRIACNKKYSNLINDYADINFICDTLNKNLGKDFKLTYKNTDKPKNWTQFNTQKEGDCFVMSQVILYPLRALGYPTAIDYTPGWGNANGRHSWNSIYYNGRWYPFMGLELGTNYYNPFLVYENLKDSTRSGYRYPAKVFRRTFAVDSTYLKIVQLFPKVRELSLFNNLKFKDVTNEYFSTVNAYIPYRSNSSNKLLFIAIYNNNKWLLTDVALLDEDKDGFIFNKLKTNMLYLPYLYPDNIAYSDPFILQDDGSIKYLTPNNECKEDISIEFLYPRFIEYIKVWSNTSNTRREDIEGIAYDYGREKPQEGSHYTLYYYNKNWIKLGTSTPENNQINFGNVPTNALLKLQGQDGKDIGRCFTFEDQKCIWW